MKCNICGSGDGFLDIDPIRPRESFQCIQCKSSSRNRLVVYALQAWLKQEGPSSSWIGDKNIIIFEISGVGPYGRYLRERFDYFNTKFDGVILKSENYNPREYADVENLNLHDNSIDIVIASDVFEHVRDDVKGYREIHRVLKPEGLFILTIPYNHRMFKTITRVEPQGNEDINLLPPVYHGGHTLVYREYGRDLLFTVQNIGYTVGYLELELPQYCIPSQSIILLTKLPYLDIHRVVQITKSNYEST